MQRVFSYCSAILVLAFVSVVGVAAAADSDVLARGKGVTVTQAQLDESFINLRGTLAAQGRPLPEQQRVTIEKQLIEKLVLTQLLLSRATEEDRRRAAAKVTKLVDEQKSKARSQERFEAQIRAAGMSPASFEKQLLERAICEEVLDRDLRPRLGVTPEKLRLFYDQNPTEFRQPERLRLQQIVFTLRSPSGTELTEADKTEKKALAGRIVERLRNGESMEALAKQYSDDPAGRERGGEYLFPIGRMVPEFETAVLTLPTNRVSDVIVTPFVYHIVKPIERMSGDLVPFDDVTNQIRIRLEVEATQAMLPEYQKQLFDEAGVEFLKKQG